MPAARYPRTGLPTNCSRHKIHHQWKKKLWIERNNWLFEDEEADSIEVWVRIQYWIALWISQGQGFDLFSIFVLVKGLEFHFAMIRCLSSSLFSFMS